MSNVSYIKEHILQKKNSDFHQQDIKFDIKKLQDAWKQAQKIK